METEIVEIIETAEDKTVAKRNGKSKATSQSPSNFKDLEKLVKDSRDKLLSIPTPVMEIDRDFNIKFLNTIGAGLVGETPDSCLGKKCYDLFQTDQCRTPECACAKAMRSKQQETQETVAHPLGKSVPINYSGIPMYDEEGAVSGALEFVVDISDTKRVLDEVKGYADKLMQIPTPIMEIDKDFNVRFLNTVGASIVGETPETAMGKKCYDLFKTEQCKTSDCACYIAMQKEQQITQETVARPNGEDVHIMYTGIPTRNTDGKIDGALEFVVDVSDARKAQIREQEEARQLKEKVDQILDVVGAAKTGDLSKNITVAGKDAIGQLGEGLAEFFTSLKGNIEGIAINANDLAKSSQSLTAVSQQMSANAEETTNQAGVVSTAAEEVSATVQTVASGSEELSASIQEIARNAAGTADQAREAVGVANQTNETVKKLGESSKEIGQVVKLITDIAAQTNLLALNATIEAARAGEAGKGFAVVANEVKELAKETTSATEDIRSKVEAIQNEITTTVGAIDAIGGLIGKINESQETVASAVEEQTATTNEIGRSVQEAAKASSEIAENIVSVATAAKDTSCGAQNTSVSAAELSKIANELEKLVQQYKF